MMLAALITTPFLLRWLGADRLGAFRAGTEWLGYVAMLELGLGASLQAVLARSMSQHDEAATRGILAAGLRAYAGPTVLMLGAGALVVGMSAWLIPVGPELAPELRLGMALSLVPILLSPLGVFRPL